MKPLTVVTGFLGSGKTTLLSRVLRAPGMEGTAVIVNEFGSVGLDHHLLRRADEATLLLENGCVCCATREDLVETLLTLLDEEGRGETPLRRVVVETTGLADPAPILYTVYAHPVLQHHYSVDQVVCAVDAVNGDLHLDSNAESTKQVAAADALVVTKTDIADSETARALVGRLRRINPSASLFDAPFGEIEPRELFGGGTKGRVDAPPEALSETDGHARNGTSSTAVTFDGAVDWAGFGIWLSMLLHARGEEVLRVKGLLDTGGPGPVVLDGVQHVMHPPRHLEAWPDGDHRSRIVFIARGIRSSELLRSLDAFRPIIRGGGEQVWRKDSGPS